MKPQRPQAAAAPEPSICPTEGWHCTHIYYSFDRKQLASLSTEQLANGKQQFAEALNPANELSPARLQSSIVAGHSADFALMLMDLDPLKIDAVHQRILSSDLGTALVPTYSFVSITEVSEYVPTIEAYTQKLIHEGETPDSPTLAAKVKAYEARLPVMNKQRLTPDFPDWPATCFYPMNKIREPGANWFTLPSSERQALMSEHARSGMQFMGRVSQLITVAVGLDDWEWGVTLWASNPQYLKDIVYKMRFDKASAKYAAFGPFYVSYISSAEAILKHCMIP